MKKLLSILIILCLIPNISLAVEKDSASELIPEPKKKKSAYLARILTYFCPGAGHVYLGKHKEAISTFIGTVSMVSICGGTFLLITDKDRTGILGGSDYALKYAAVIVMASAAIAMQAYNAKSVISIANGSDNSSLSSSQLTFSKVFSGSIGCGWVVMPLIYYSLIENNISPDSWFDEPRFPKTSAQIGLMSMPIGAAWSISNRGKEYGENGSFLMSLLGSYTATLLYYLITPSRAYHDDLLIMGAVPAIAGALIGYNLSRINPNSVGKKQATKNASINMVPIITPEYQGIMVAKRF